ncbi:hypothetical protein pb186bvf_001749 [Paramecium bursaria]
MIDQYIQYLLDFMEFLQQILIIQQIKSISTFVQFIRSQIQNYFDFNISYIIIGANVINRVGGNMVKQKGQYVVIKELLLFTTQKHINHMINDSNYNGGITQIILNKIYIIGAFSVFSDNGL